MKRKRQAVPDNVVVLAEYRERRMREAMAEIDRALDEALCDVLGCNCDPTPGGHIIPAGIMDEVLPLASERLEFYRPQGAPINCRSQMLPPDGVA